MADKPFRSPGGTAGKLKGKFSDIFTRDNRHGALQDMSGDGKKTFADTYVGDLLGLDGKMGTGDRPGLLASLTGGRRSKSPETSKRPKARPSDIPRYDGTVRGVSAAPDGSLDVAAEPQGNRVSPSSHYPARGGPQTTAEEPPVATRRERMALSIGPDGSIIREAKAKGRRTLG